MSLKKKLGTWALTQKLGAKGYSFTHQDLSSAFMEQKISATERSLGVEILDGNAEYDRIKGEALRLIGCVEEAAVIGYNKIKNYFFN